MTTENFNCGDLDVLYSAEDYKRVDDYFTVQKLLMATVGQHPRRLNAMLPKCMQGFGIVLAKMYSLVVIANSCFFGVLLTKTVFDNIVEGNLMGMCDAMTMALIYTVSCFSTTYFLWQFKPLTEYMNKINRKYRHHSMAGLTFVTYYVSYRKVRTFAVVWVLTCFAGVSAWGMAPIILRIRTLPLKIWYPYDVMAPVVFELNYFWQFFGQVNTGTTFSICSGLFLTFVVLFLSQFDVLYCSIKNLNFHAQLLCGEDLNMLREIQAQLPFHENDELNQYLLLEEHKTDLNVFNGFYAKRKNSFQFSTQQAALHESLKECILLHRFLLKACAQLESFFHPYNLVITLQCTIQLCTLVFAAVAGEQSMIRVFNQLQYFALTLTNLFIFTYCSELLHQQGVRSGQAFWRSQWTPFNMHLIRRDVMIFLLNSTHMVKLTAGKFYTMDINHLRKTLTQVFSLFTLLRKLADKKD